MMMMTQLLHLGMGAQSPLRQMSPSVDIDVNCNSAGPTVPNQQLWQGWIEGSQDCMETCCIQNLAVYFLGLPPNWPVSLFLPEKKAICAAPGPAAFVCPECRDCLSSQDYLDKHMLKSHAKGPQGRLQCSYCPYTSNWRTSITRHERTHTGERPFVCQLCQKGFTEKGNLRTHLRTVHAKERPHECDVCGQRFSLASNLAQHRRAMHTRDGSSFTCPQCGRGFTRLGHLHRHLLTHTKERPHVCTTCGMPFAELGNMKKHKMVVHERRYPFWCPHCRKGLACVRDLRQHMQARHRGEGEGAALEGEE